MNKSADIVIHINEELDEQHRLTFSGKVQKIPGVRSTSSTDARPHLMIVEYNPEKTKACDVVDNVRNIGMQAQLVGWL